MAWIKQMMKAAGGSGVLQPNRDLFFVWNKSMIERTVKSLVDAFPDGTLHAFAAKANGLEWVLKELQASGMGCEAASIGEFRQGMKIFDEAEMVFDSPCKTVAEIHEALSTKCLFNIDNFQELQRVVEFFEASPEKAKARVGIRVNPQVGAGSLGIFSTGTATSKFGIPLIDCRQELLDAYKKHNFLTCVHVHSGSQGFSLDTMVEGVKRIVELADEIGQQVTEIDIGGGMTVDFTTDDWTPPFAKYASLLKEQCPKLFDRRVVTEFGRSILAKTGVLVSKIEYTKEAGGRRIATQHAGTDIAIRTVWAPQDWPLRVTPFTPSGILIPPTDLAPTDLAGPCCLGGDILAHQRPLPPLTPMSYVAFHDVGAYYHSSYSYYNLRQAPPLYSYVEGSSEVILESRGHTVEETLQLYSQ